MCRPAPLSVGAVACSLYWHIGLENFGPNSVNIGAALFMVTILPAFAACAYTPQLVGAHAQRAACAMRAALRAALHSGTAV